MYLDDKISKEAYDDKYSEISNKLDKCEEEKHLFSDCVLSQKNIADKMKLIRQKLKGADVLDEFYGNLNQRYYGDSVEPGGEIAMEWARIPHFYYNFYVYQYATGFAAATALANKVVHGTVN